MKFPDWAIGPFEKAEENPVLSPRQKGFDSWAVYNPAVAIKDGTYYMFYRCEDRVEYHSPYAGTSRIGLATSTDGINFDFSSDKPVIDADMELEKPGGCEDPRIVKLGDEWIMIYTAYHYPKSTYIFYATSKDLINWEKMGPFLKDAEGNAIPGKSAAVVCDPEGNAVKINGRYVMYTNSQICYSEDFFNWETRYFNAAAFTGNLNEVCVAVTDYKNPGKDDIVLFLAGNFTEFHGKDKYFYAICESLYSRTNPTKLLDFYETPVIEATLACEKSTDRLHMVQSAYKGTIFLDSVLRYQGRWLAYYGAADQYVCLTRSKD